MPEFTYLSDNTYTPTLQHTYVHTPQLCNRYVNVNMSELPSTL